MKPQLLKIQSQPFDSFTVRKEIAPNINSRWHYHPEIELIHFQRGTGMQFIGDNMMPFKPGDVVLVGPNLPHYWRFDKFPSAKEGVSYSTVIHFRENFWGEHFTALPETRQIKGVLEKSKHGILIRGKNAKQVMRAMQRVYSAQGISRLIALIETLCAFAETKDQVILSSLGFKYSYSSTEDERVHNIYEYTIQHAHEKIALHKIASVAGMAKNSFCRYFKSRTGKTYSQFVTEIRIGQACKFLIENKMSIKQVCFSSGFNNFSCFFTKFKEVTGKTPLQYKHTIISDN
jgi:AraC-like DNA-binding protein/quercetin dioxygenase-like cupin family protein